MGDLATRSEMSKQLLNGVGGVGVGVGLLVLWPLFGWVTLVAGGVCAAIGAGILASKSNKKAGGVLAVAGILAGGASLLSLVLTGLNLGFLVPIAGIGLIALGGFSLFKFFKEMKKRS